MTAHNEVTAGKVHPSQKKKERSSLRRQYQDQKTEIERRAEETFSIIP